MTDKLYPSVAIFGTATSGISTLLSISETISILAGIAAFAASCVWIWSMIRKDRRETERSKIP